MVNTVLKNKITEFFNKTSESLQTGSMTIQEIPVNDILKIMRAAFACNEGEKSKDSIDMLINNNIAMLYLAIERNNLAMAIIIIRNIELQCIAELDINEQASDNVQAVSKEFADHILLCQETDAYVHNKYSEYVLGNKRKNQFTGKGVIYTAVTGGYDDIWNPEYVSDDFDYICFTDDPNYKSDVWTTVLLDNDESLDNVRLARKCKCLALDLLKDYDYSIWLDGKFCIRSDPRSLIDAYSCGSGLLVFPHFARDCVYEEANACLTLKRGDPFEIEKQIKKIRESGYPEHNGMVDTGCLIRNHHDEKLRIVMREWWEEIKNESNRDQLSFNYICKKNNYSYDLCNLNLYDNIYLYNKNHK